MNLRLRGDALAAIVDAINDEPEAWGRVAPIRARAVSTWSSCRPTRPGPLTIGNARGAFVGDLLCRVLAAGGQDVTREYYFNDSGAQISNLGASVVAIRRGEPIPEEGYKGAYVEDLAAELPDDVWAAAPSPTGPTPPTSSAAGRRPGSARGSRHRSTDLGVRFDVWTSEAPSPRRGLGRARGRAPARARPRRTNRTGRCGSARPTFGDDKDRVIYRSDGRPTYFAADIGYVTEKFSRGFDHLIYIWGADHHGTVARVRNAAEAMGYDREAVQVLALLLGPLRA